jgi:hypothetical protein
MRLLVFRKKYDVDPLTKHVYSESLPGFANLKQVEKLTVLDHAENTTHRTVPIPLKNNQAVYPSNGAACSLHLMLT